MANDQNPPPLTCAETQEIIASSEATLAPEQTRLWELIKMPPVKWELTGYGDSTGGFWVVALLGAHAIWYNEIEEGFNLSSWSHYGRIDETGYEQFELSELLWQLIARLKGHPLYRY